MRALSQLSASYTLCLLLGIAGATPAQSTRTPPKRSVANADAEKLNNLIAAAQTAIDQKDYVTAASDYSQYLAKKPDDPIVHYDLGYAYTALQRPADAKAEYEKAISLDPKMAAAYLNLGLTLLTTEPVAAIEALQKAADLTPNDARARFLLGSALERNGKLSPAIEQFQASETLDPRDFDCRLALGRSLLAAGRSDESEKEFKAAIDLRPVASAAQLGLAQSLLAQKQWESGATQMAIYIEAEPKDMAARKERAGALVALGKYDDALAELDVAATAVPEDLYALKLRSKIYISKNRYADAAPFLQKAAVLAPQDADIAASLGHAYAEKKDYPDAVRELSVAYRADPKAVDVLADLLAAEYATKNYSVTLQLLDTLARLKELPLESWFIRADCYDKLMQPFDALDTYRKFLQLNKDQTSDMYFAASSRERALTRELANKKRK